MRYQPGENGIFAHLLALGDRISNGFWSFRRFSEFAKAAAIAFIIISIMVTPKPVVANIQTRKYPDGGYKRCSIDDTGVGKCITGMDARVRSA